MRKLIHESPFVHKRSEISKRLVESILGIEVIEQDPDMDMGLQVINALGNRGGSIEGLGRGELYGRGSWRNGSTIMDEFWFKPEYYAGTTLEEDEKTISGETVKAGMPLEKQFPDGMSVVAFNERKVVAGIFREKPRFVGGVYHIQSFSGVGKGTTDAVEISEQLNIGHTAAMTILKRFGAGGGYAYDRNVMTKTEAQALIKPGGLVGVDITGRYKSISDALWQVTHTNVSAENLAIVAQLANMLNVCFQTTNFTDGVADSRVNVDTAQGQQLLAAQNQQRSAATLRMKGYQMARIGEHVIELFRQHITIPRWFGTNDKFGLAKGKFIASKDLPERVTCDFVNDSELPTNTYTKRENALKMFEAFGGPIPFLQLVNAEPAMAMYWASQFQCEIPTLNMTDVLIRCQDRLDQIDDLCSEFETLTQIAGFQPPPEAAIPEILSKLTPPVSLSEESHLVKAQLLGQVLDDDEVKEWPPIKLATVEGLIALHERLQAQKLAGQAALAAGADMGIQAAGALAGAAVNAPAAEHERAAAKENETDARNHDEVSKQKDFEREQVAKDADRSFALQLEKEKQKAVTRPVGRGT
jgi:hypothetical protein